MSSSSRIIQEALALPAMERLDVIEQLWESIASESNCLELTEAQRRELDRRIADMDSNPDSGIPWDEVKQSRRN